MIYYFYSADFSFDYVVAYTGDYEWEKSYDLIDNLYRGEWKCDRANHPHYYDMALLAYNGMWKL